jgi:hypothetical protein
MKKVKSDVVRPRIFAIVRNGARLQFNCAQTGEMQLQADTRDIDPRCMEDVIVYGTGQLLADRAAKYKTLDEKRECMRAVWAKLRDGTFSLAERASASRLVMADVFNAGRALGKLYSKLDDEAARKEWAAASDYNRIRFSQIPEVSAKVAEMVGGDQPDVEDIFA